MINVIWIIGEWILLSIIIKQWDNAINTYIILLIILNQSRIWIDL